MYFGTNYDIYSLVFTGYFIEQELSEHKVLPSGHFPEEMHLLL